MYVDRIYDIIDKTIDDFFVSNGKNIKNIQEEQNFVKYQKEINEIFHENVISDLQNHLKTRNCLNKTNIFLVYLFHLIQSSGILVTSIAVSNNNTRLAWIGIGLNMCSSLISMYEKINTNIMKKLLNDMHSMKNGTYIDEGILSNISKDNNTYDTYNLDITDNTKNTKNTDNTNNTNITDNIKNTDITDNIKNTDIIYNENKDVKINF